MDLCDGGQDIGLDMSYGEQVLARTTVRESDRQVIKFKCE